MAVSRLSATLPSLSAQVAPATFGRDAHVETKPEGAQAGLSNVARGKPYSQNASLGNPFGGLLLIQELPTIVSGDNKTLDQQILVVGQLDWSPGTRAVVATWRPGVTIWFHPLFIDDYQIT